MIDLFVLYLRTEGPSASFVSSHAFFVPCLITLLKIKKLSVFHSSLYVNVHDNSNQLSLDFL